MSSLSSPVVSMKTTVPFFGTLRGILFLVWSQAKGKSFFMAYALPFLGVFVVSYFLVLEPNSASFESWIVDTFLLVALPLIALSVSGGLLRDEIKDSTLEYLWTRPASRLRLIVGFYLGAVLKTLFYGCLLIASIWLAGVLKGASPDVLLLPRLLSALFFSALVFCAGGLLFATVTGKYMIWGIIYGAAFEMGVGRLPTNISRLTLKHHIEAIGGFGAGPVSGQAFTSVLVCMVFAGFCVAAAGLVFSIKSYSLGQEKEG